MPIFSMAFGAAKEGDDGKKTVHFRGAFTKWPKTLEDAERCALLQANAYYPPSEGWEQHTTDVQEIPVSWSIEIARSEFNFAHVWDMILRGVQSDEQKRLAEDVFTEFVTKIQNILHESIVRAFPMAVILSATTGIMITSIKVDDFRGLKALARHLDVDPCGLPQAIFAQHPELDVDTSGVTDWNNWMMDMVAQYGPALSFKGKGDIAPRT